jgi:hypothetical protein
MNHLNSLYQQVLLSISIVLSDYEKQVKVGRPPKVSDLQIACLYVTIQKENELANLDFKHPIWKGNKTDS